MGQILRKVALCAGVCAEIGFKLRKEVPGGEVWVQKKGKLDISHRYNRIPLLPSGPGGVLQELVVYDLPGHKGSKIYLFAKQNAARCTSGQEICLFYGISVNENGSKSLTESNT